MTSLKNACYDFEFTLKAEAGQTEHSVGEVLDTIYKKWTFQKEQGEQTDYLHWQGCGSLYKKTRSTHLIASLIEETDSLRNYCIHL